MHNKRLSKTPSSINSNSQAAEQNPKLAYRPFGSQIQKASVAPVTQSTKEDVAFAEQKMEAFGLELQAKYGKITPEGQERLTVLQAKMASFSSSQLEHARRYSHNIANIPLRRPDTAIPIQAKLTIGEPGDKYEQEADETARQVVQRIHQPQNEKLQRESLPEEEDELQMKPLGNIQRESLPDEEEELQMKPMVQRVSDGGMAATQDLEASINQARGGGQPLAKNIREPMEQGFGADFSRVKVHTDTQADQLNRSIQAKAFTTGQDVFFRQGAYEPGSRGGQELIAHELTHVVQQNGGAVHREKLQDESEAKEIRKREQSSELSYSPRTVTSNRKSIQRTIIELTELKTNDLKKKKEVIYNRINDAVDGLVQKTEVFKEIKRLQDEKDKNYTLDEVIEEVINSQKYKKKPQPERGDAAEKHKLEQIEPYINMLNHMAGEEKDGQVQGGHLFTDMKEQWKKELQFKRLSGDENGLWNMEWRIKDNQNWKTSSMFPKNWTNKDLTTALLQSNMISGKLQLPHITGTGCIEIQKAGNTFYPVKFIESTTEQ